MMSISPTAATAATPTSYSSRPSAMAMTQGATKRVLKKRTASNTREQHDVHAPLEGAAQGVEEGGLDEGGGVVSLLRLPALQLLLPLALEKHMAVLSPVLVHRLPEVIEGQRPLSAQHEDGVEQVEK